MAKGKYFLQITWGKESGSFLQSFKYYPKDFMDKGDLLYAQGS
jgi:hypothetical protein